jgi:hypothetical protein
VGFPNGGGQFGLRLLPKEVTISGELEHKGSAMANGVTKPGGLQFILRLGDHHGGVTDTRSDVPEGHVVKGLLLEMEKRHDLSGWSEYSGGGFFGRWCRLPKIHRK